MGLTPEGTIKKSPLYRLQDLTIGDSVVVDFEGRRYQYEVHRKYAVSPQQTSIEIPTPRPVLTLYSCTLRGSADGRDVWRLFRLERGSCQRPVPSRLDLDVLLIEAVGWLAQSRRSDRFR